VAVSSIQEYLFCGRGASWHFLAPNLILNACSAGNACWHYQAATNLIMWPIRWVQS